MKHLSQTSLYALQAVYALAETGGSEPVPIGDIASRQQIPRRFLEEILRRLRQAGIVRSTRGKCGGYQLQSSPRDLTPGQVVRIFEGDSRKTVEAESVLAGVLEDAAQAYMERLDRLTLEELILKAERDRFVPNYCI